MLSVAQGAVPAADTVSYTAYVTQTQDDCIVAKRIQTSQTAIKHTH